MSKTSVNQNSSHALSKKQGRSKGPLVQDPVMKDTVTIKILNSRKKNNPNRY